LILSYFERDSIDKISSNLDPISSFLISSIISGLYLYLNIISDKIIISNSLISILPWYKLSNNPILGLLAFESSYIYFSFY
jgi:hypothetical protein